MPIGKRVPLMPWIKVPAATITFCGRADVLPALSNRLVTTADANGDICFYVSSPTALIVDINATADTAITPIDNLRTAHQQQTDHRVVLH